MKRVKREKALRSVKEMFLGIPFLQKDKKNIKNQWKAKNKKVIDI